MEHEYYKEYYDLERNHWWFKAREEIIITAIKSLISRGDLKSGHLNILNVGCGPGRSSEYLSAFGTVTSIEYDAFCCEFASKKTGLKIIHGSITELPFQDGVFDLVCAFDVIEHVENDTLAVAEMHRVAVAGGIKFVTVPAFMSLWSNHDVVNHHFRRYTTAPLKKIFTGLQQTELFCSYFNFFLFPPIFFFRKLSNLIKSGSRRKGSGSDFEAFNPSLANNILYRIFRGERKFVRRRVKMPFGSSIVHIAKKTA